MVEKKLTKEEVVVNKEQPKKTCKKTSTVKKDVLDISMENVGFKAGDVYQALATAKKALSVKEIAKLAGISEEETLLGMGWLYKEGKIFHTDNKVSLT